MRRRRMQKRVAILVIALLFAVLTVVLIAVALQRGSAPTDATPGEITEPNSPQQTDPPVTTDAPQTTTPETTAPPETTVPPQTTAVPPENDGRITICIDPGHGFDDNGASSEYLVNTHEKDITLAISLKLRAALESAGFHVIMTHDTNQIPADAPLGEMYLFGLAKRTEFANKHMPDLYVSIHADSFDDPTVNGSRVYFQTVTGKDNSAITAIGQKFVNSITAAFPSAKRPMLKPMEDDNAYYVLRNTNMPAVLIEVGFATHPGDAANMVNPTWQQQMADAIANGVKAIFPS